MAMSWERHRMKDPPSGNEHAVGAAVAGRAEGCTSNRRRSSTRCGSSAHGSTSLDLSISTHFVRIFQNLGLNDARGCLRE